MTVDINELILNLDTELANFEFKNTEVLTQDLKDYLTANLLNVHDVRKPYPRELMFDVDVDDYTITLHYYDKPSDIPSNAINLGMSFYMYPCVEVVEPCYIGMCSIVQVFDTNYNKKYAIQAV